MKCRSPPPPRSQYQATQEVDFEIDCLKANAELMISRLSEDQRAELGLIVTPALQGGRPGTTARTKAIVQAQATAAAAQEAVAQAKAATQKKAARKKPAGEHMQCSPPPPISNSALCGHGWLAGAKRGRADLDEEKSCNSDLEWVKHAGRYTGSY